MWWIRAMIFCVCLPGIMENSINYHGRVMEFYYQIPVGTLNKNVSLCSISCIEQFDIISFSSIQEFVVIQASPKRKRVLTEHQKEVKREKRYERHVRVFSIRKEEPLPELSPQMPVSGYSWSRRTQVADKVVSPSCFRSSLPSFVSILMVSTPSLL